MTALDMYGGQNVIVRSLQEIKSDPQIKVIEEHPGQYIRCEYKNATTLKDRQQMTMRKQMFDLAGKQVTVINVVQRGNDAAYFNIRQCLSYAWQPWMVKCINNCSVVNIDDLF